MKKVTFNSRKKVYIVTEKGKKGIQAQSKQPPKDEPGMVWECENPHKKKDSTGADYVHSLSTTQNESDDSAENKKPENKSSKGGLFSSLFSS